MGEKMRILEGVGNHFTEKKKTMDTRTKISLITPACPLSPISFQPQKNPDPAPTTPLPSADADARFRGVFIQCSLVYAFSIIVQEKIPRMMRAPVELGVR
jgi:hypothetical protein